MPCLKPKHAYSRDRDRAHLRRRKQMTNRRKPKQDPILRNIADLANLMTQGREQ